MKTKSVILAALLATLSGCVTPPQKITIKEEFNVVEAKSLLAEGKNSVHGSSLIRQRGGGVVTCAGNEVILTPATSYATERMLVIYGSADRGYNPAMGGKNIVFENQHALYGFMTKKALCDAQGFFKFENLADGSFYVVSQVIWESGRAGYEGGFIMQKVTVKGGESKEIILAP